MSRSAICLRACAIVRASSTVPDMRWISCRREHAQRAHAGAEFALECRMAKTRAKHAADARAPKGNKRRENSKGVQTGARRHPGLPLPRQHQAKPGRESELRPRPQYDAPAYKGSDKLLDMVALITGGDSGIGRSV